MRKVMLVGFLIVLVGSMASAQEGGALPWFGTHYQPGNTAYSLELGVDFGLTPALVAVPGVEVILSKFRPLSLFSLDLGLAGRGLAAFAFNSSGTTITVGGAPLLMFHAGLRGVGGGSLPALEQLDFYTGFGLGYLLSLGPAGGAGGLVWANASGINYFVNDSLALRVGTNYFSPIGAVGLGSFSTNVGVVLKLGPAEDVSEGTAISIPDMDAMSGEATYFTFSSLYALAVISGGFLPTDESFAEGDGVVLMQEYSDQGGGIQQITLFRALLHEDDEQSWWRYEFELDEESFAFEAAVNDEQEVLLLRYEDQATGEVTLYEPSNPRQFENYGDQAVRTEEELASLVTGQERISVPAGTFNTDRLESREDDGEFVWWITEDVPGRMVRFEGQTGDGDAVFGELIEIVRGYESPWGPAW